MPLLTLDRLSMAFGHLPLLDETSLQVEPRERVCVLGRNGSGKSTLLRILNGEQLPNAGTVWRQPNLRVARLDQDVPLAAHLPIFDVVAKGAKTPGRPITDDIGLPKAGCSEHRTAQTQHEVEMLRQQGLALGGSLENAIVLSETGVLNNQLRFEDEFVRHKILDAIGELSLVGHPIIGHLVAHRAGHELHTVFAKRILEERDAWKVVELVPEQAAGFVPAAVPVKAG